MSAHAASTETNLRFTQRGTLRALANSLFRTRRPELRPSIRARTGELQSKRGGRLVYYTNVGDFAHVSARPLVLLHAIHTTGNAYELNGVFEALREERPIYALDLPGFGCSERRAQTYGPEVYTKAIEELLQLATLDAQPADVLAVGLTAEYAASAAIHAPNLVHSLTLVAPTGFAVKREQDAFERASRKGKALLPVRLATMLGLSPLLYRTLVTERSIKYLLRRAACGGHQQDDFVRHCYATTHQPGAEHAALAYLSGALHPTGNPQSVYTRVHCPTLILHAEDGKARYGSLETFVKWHEYFMAEQVEHTELSEERGAATLVDRMRSFWERVSERDREEESGVYGVVREGDAPPDVAAVSSY